MELVVASHNLMDGRRLDGLLRDHARVHDAERLGVLCIQENRRPDGSACAPQIVGALGNGFDYIGDHPRTRLSIVFDRSQLELVDHHVFELPCLDKLSRVERLFIGGSTPQQKYVQISRFRTRTGRSVAVVNFHLDTAGGNDHRLRQVEAIATRMADFDLGPNVFACGDTNAFSIRRAAQLRMLAHITAPLADLGLRDRGDQPTHFFARQREPKFTHRLAVAFGRIGIDAPGRYDVVCTNASETGRGQVSTPDSDHDLVWARGKLS